MAGISYFPILKAKQGELNALSKWEPSRLTDVFPILEVVPWERDAESFDLRVDQIAEDAEVDKAVNRIAKAWIEKDSLIFIDAAGAEPDPESGWAFDDQTPVLGKMLVALRRLGLNVGVVVRASAQPDYLSALNASLREVNCNRVVIRITAEDLDDTVVPLRDLVERVSRLIHVDENQTDVLMDFGAVVDEAAAAMASRLARFVLPQLDDGRYRSLVLSSGAFPVNLSAISPSSSGLIDRHDWLLWQSVSKLDLRVPLHFSDYGVTHPVLPQGVGFFAAPPQLRYTLGSKWLIRKGSRTNRKGHAQFYDVCEQVLSEVGPMASPSSASWGDDYIHKAAAAAGGQNLLKTGTGNASTWRAIATSRHLALVARQLADSDAL